MSSVGSSFAQKRSNASLLSAVQEVVAGTNLADTPCIVVTIPIPDTVVSLSDISGHVAYYGLLKGQLFRDLGREIVIYNDSTSLKSPEKYRFRECVYLNSATQEGVAGNTSQSSRFLKVREDTGALVSVARIG